VLRGEHFHETCNKVWTQETCIIPSSFVGVRNSISYPYIGKCTEENLVVAVTSFGKSTALLPPSSPMKQGRLLGQGYLNIEDSRSRSHTTPQSVGLLWTSDRHDTEISDNTRHSKETNIHALVGILTHNPSKRAAADPRLRPCGHRTGRSTWYST
jgi:hypothetical protein